MLLETCACLFRKVGCIPWMLALLLLILQSFAAEATNHILTLSRLHPEFCWITESASGRLLRLDRGKLAAVIDPVSR
jgi:hypothetical protein